MSRLPNLSAISLGAVKRKLWDTPNSETTVKIMNPTLTSFLVCLNEEVGTKHLLQTILFENADLTLSLNNIPNSQIWESATSFDFELNLTMENMHQSTCLNQSSVMALTRLDNSSNDITNP
jgi:hypothetical protein